MSGELRRPPQLWEQRLARTTSIFGVGVTGGDTTSLVPPASPPGSGGGTDDGPTLPPPGDFIKPSTPTLFGAVQGIRVSWDGLNSAGDLWPYDTSWVEVHMSTAGTAFTVGTATLQGRLARPGGLYVGGLTAGTTYYFRLQGVDPAGNVTEASDAASGQTGLTTSSDYGTATIGSGAVSFNARQIGGVTNTVGAVAPSNPLLNDVWLDSSPGTAIIHKIWNGSTWVTNAWGSASIAAGQITALQIAAGAVTAGAIAAGAITADKIQAGAVTTDKLTAGTISGFYISGGTINGGYINGGTVNAGYINGGTVNAAVYTGGSISSSTFTGGTIAGNIAATGTISSPYISGGTISGGYITGGTINAGYINGGTVNGAVMRTRDGAGRVELANNASHSDSITWFGSSNQVIGYIRKDPFSDDLLVSGDTNWLSSDISADNITANVNLSAGGTITADTVRPTADLIVFQGYRETATAGDVIMRLTSNVTTTNQAKFEVDADGDVKSRTNSYAGFSDARYKENIESARDYLDDLRQVEVVTFNWQGSDQKLLGVTAQQIQPIFPSMVAEDEDGTLSVRYSVFVPMLLTAVQSLADQVDDLRARIEALEA
jgi:hypothetical protein